MTSVSGVEDYLSMGGKEYGQYNLVYHDNSCSALITGFGIYAWNRKKPMWFWSGSSVKENEISDIRAYNHANGVMWIVYSLVLWAASLAGFWNGTAALTLIILAMVVGLPALMMVYQRIYKNIEYEESTKDSITEITFTLSVIGVLTSACLLIASDHEPTCAEYRCKKSRWNGNIYCIVSEGL